MGHQHNTANNGSVYAVQDGNINISGTSTTSPAGHGRETAAAERIRLLMLAANPGSTARLAIDEEAREITERLRLARDRDDFELITCLAVRPMDLLQYLNQHSPHVVHFSGHGGRNGEIALSAADSADRWVSTTALAELFRVTNDRISVVVLNACHSATQIREIGRFVDHVVGMRTAITDEAATIFAAAFYSALGFGRPIPQAFEQAVAMVTAYDPASRHIPELVVRPNADPNLRLHPAREGAS